MPDFANNTTPGVTRVRVKFIIELNIMTWILFV